MKKLLLILLCLPIIGFGQKTYVPDDTFEQKLIDFGYDNILDDSVLTSNINFLTELYLYHNQVSTPINNLTGIEDFVALEKLTLTSHQIASLDLSNNIFLTNLYIGENSILNINLSNNTLLDTLFVSEQISNIDLSQNTALTSLTINNCDNLTNIDLSQNTVLAYLIIAYNDNLTDINLSQNILLYDLWIHQNVLLNCLDVSYNTELKYLTCNDNALEQLNTKNLNWIDMIVDARNNNLACVEVDNMGWATTHWDFDSFTTLSTNCNYTSPCNSISSIDEQITNKNLLKTTNLLGKETIGSNNEIIFYIYDDGTVEKRIILE